MDISYVQLDTRTSRFLHATLKNWEEPGDKVTQSTVGASDIATVTSVVRHLMSSSFSFNVIHSASHVMNTWMM